MTEAGAFSVAVRREAGPDAVWDEFVEQAPGGHHVQTSRWAEVKRTVGWRALRVVVERDRRLVSGCQVLLRPLGRLGAVAYVPRGPVDAPDATAAERAATLDALDRLAKEERFLHLKIQPPAGGETAAAALQRRGYRRSRLETAPTATVMLDVRRSTEDLRAAMRANARRNLRRAERQGVVVREGDERDLATLIRLIGATASRQGFDPYPDRYYETMWQAFATDGHAHLVVAEHEGDPLAALMLIAFGETVLYKIGGWSGEPRSIRPNELAHWHAAQWASRAGYRWYDLEGIDLAIARAVLAGDEPPKAPQAGVSHFKLGLGGAITVFPAAYDRVPRGPLGRASRGPAIAFERLAPWALGRGT